MRKVTFREELIAIYIPASHGRSGIEFATDDSATMQVGVLIHPKNKIIDSHYHLPIQRESHLTQEVLFIRRGVVRVDLYSDDREYIESILLKEFDTILLMSGGHGFEILEDADMVEVKTGPYTEGKDKELFQSDLPETKVFKV